MHRRRIRVVVVEAVRKKYGSCDGGGRGQRVVEYLRDQDPPPGDGRGLCFRSPSPAFRDGCCGATLPITMADPNARHFECDTFGRKMAYRAFAVGRPALADGLRRRPPPPCQCCRCCGGTSWTKIDDAPRRRLISRRCTLSIWSSGKRYPSALDNPSGIDDQKKGHNSVRSAYIANQ